MKKDKKRRLASGKGQEKLFLLWGFSLRRKIHITNVNTHIIVITDA